MCLVEVRHNMRCDICCYIVGFSSSGNRNAKRTLYGIVFETGDTVERLVENARLVG